MIPNTGLLLGGQLACSRACAEAGWIDASPQVGQTENGPARTSIWPAASRAPFST
ncbi:MAG: FAD-binding protein [Eisenbergiella sp.]